MPDSSPSAERIVNAALDLVLAQGVKKTSLEEVAQRAGVTRVTVYRYFRDKKGLVRAVCRQVVGVFQAAARCCRDGPQDLESCLTRIGQALRDMPGGQLLARLEEIGRLYPDVHEEFRDTRTKALDGIFQEMLQMAHRQGKLREDLNFEVVMAVFWDAVVRLGENPAIISLGLPTTEIFETVARVFRHGIVKE